jgi:putative ABC transport system permease protein
MKTLLSDVRHALRVLSKSPGVAAVAVVSLALGIGANTAIFSVVHGMILKPLPFPHPEAIVSLEEKNRDGSPSGQTGWATYADWRARSRSLSEVAVASYWDPKLSSVGTPAEKLEGLRVSDGFFRVLGIRPALGRDFLPAEDRQGAPRVAILSHGLWTRRFGADPSLVGRTVSISDTPFTVVGVLPASFESIFSPLNYAPAEIWSPLRYDASSKSACRTCRHLRAFARVRDGVPIEKARAELDGISTTLWKEYPADYGAPGIVMTPLAKHVTGTLRPVLWALLGAVAFVLLIACANVASLLLSQAASRRREIAIRTALGAGRGRIVQMFLTEALLLAVIGGALGVAVSAWSLDALVGLAPGHLPRLSAIRLEPAVLLFSLAISVATGALFGLAPALAMAGKDPQAALRDGGGSGRQRSLRSTGLLVSFDTALAFLLLFGAGLLVRSTARLLNVDPGFAAQRVLKLEVDLSGKRYQEDAPVVAYFDRVLERTRAIPGVLAAGVVSELPLGGNWDGFGIRVEGHEPANPTEKPDALRYGATPGYLDAMGIPVRRGRGFTDADREGALRVALVNEAMARALWPGKDPIGRRVGLGDHPWATIVGIVGDVRHRGLDEEPGNQVYVPLAQWADSSGILVVRSAGDPGPLASAVVSAVRGIDPEQPVSHVATLASVVADSAGTRRFAMDLLAGFGVLATLLAAVGIYGVVSGYVARRKREIGVRMALGADRFSILRLIGGKALRLTAIGLVAGSLGAWALGRVLRTLLFEVGPTDALALATGAVVVLAVSFGASLLPTRRATRIDPLVCLRSE